MSPTPQDAQDLPDGVDPERHITTPFQCPTCEYDLRYATLAGRCSQCGNLYNARTQGPIGIAKLRAASVAPEEFDLPDGVTPGRHITRSLYCDQCGHCLRYATLVGRCAECGNPYNARYIIPTGVFRPGSVRVPIWEILVGTGLSLAAYYLIRTAFAPIVVWRLSAGGIFAALGLGCAAAATREFQRLIRFRTALRRIRGMEDDETDDIV